jgi:hypothetical protein
MSSLEEEKVDLSSTSLQYMNHQKYPVSKKTDLIFVVTCNNIEPDFPEYKLFGMSQWVFEKHSTFLSDLENSTFKRFKQHQFGNDISYPKEAIIWTIDNKITPKTFQIVLDFITCTDKSTFLENVNIKVLLYSLPHIVELSRELKLDIIIPIAEVFCKYYLKTANPNLSRKEIKEYIYRIPSDYPVDIYVTVEPGLFGLNDRHRKFKFNLFEFIFCQWVFREYNSKKVYSDNIYEDIKNMGDDVLCCIMNRLFNRRTDNFSYYEITNVNPSTNSSTNPNPNPNVNSNTNPNPN